MALGKGLCNNSLVVVVVVVVVVVCGVWPEYQLPVSRAALKARSK